MNRIKYRPYHSYYLTPEHALNCQLQVSDIKFYTATIILYTATYTIIKCYSLIDHAMHHSLCLQDHECNNFEVNIIYGMVFAAIYEFNSATSIQATSIA